MREHTAGCHGHLGEELVEFVVIAHSQLDVARNNALALGVVCHIPGYFENFRYQIFKDGRQVHWRTTTNAFGVEPSTEVAMHAANGELKSRKGRPRMYQSTLAIALALALPRHLCV